MECGDFIFDCVNLLYYKHLTINLNHGGLYGNYLDWIKNKKQQ